MNNDYGISVRTMDLGSIPRLGRHDLPILEVFWRCQQVGSTQRLKSPTISRQFRQAGLSWPCLRAYLGFDLPSMATWVSQLQSWELLRRLQEVMMFVLFLSRVNSALPGKLSFWRHDPWPQPYMLVMLQVQVSQVSSHTRQMWGAIAFPVSLKGMMRVLSCDAQTLLGSKYPDAAAGKDNMEAILLCRWALEGFATLDEIQEGLKSVQLHGLQSAARS